MQIFVMTTYTLLLLLLFASCNLAANSDLRIGLLLSMDSEIPGMPSIYSSGGAAQIAVEEVEQRYNHNITILWDVLLNTNSCDVGPTLISGYDYGTKKNASVIIGPPCSKAMDVVTKLMAVLTDGPVHTLTWLPRQESASFPNDTISTYASYETMSKALVVVLTQFKWGKIGIITTRDEFCDSLITTANDMFPNKDLNIVRRLYIDDFTKQTITDTLNEVKDHARVVIICMEPKYLQMLLIEAHNNGMTSNEYAFIYCRFEPSIENELLTKEILSNPDILGPLLQVGYFRVDTEQYKTFSKDANTKRLLTTPQVLDCCHTTDQFSISLYYTILLVADVCLNNTNGPHVQPFNASKLERILYSSRFGPKRVSKTGTIQEDVVVTYYQHGTFQNVGIITDTYKKIDDIEWSGGSIPSDSPKCGWHGNQCTTGTSKGNNNAAIIGSLVSIAVILIVAGVLYAYYRKAKLEKELLNMIWKVNNNEIRLRRPHVTAQNSLQGHGQGQTSDKQSKHPKKKLVRADTRGTIGLGSTSSIDKTLLFAPVGSYKGSIVAVKDIQRRSIQLTRETLRDLKSLRELQHENLNPFIGVSLETGNNYILMKYCSKGSLQDVLENDDIKLDNMFKMSFLMDLGRGLDFLHRTPVKSHGNLKSSNCVIDSRWVLKLTDYGAICLQTFEEPDDLDAEHEYYSRLLWTAPELLRMQRRSPKGTQKGDVYSFAIIMYEILHRCPPYYFNNAPSSKTIINRIRNYEDPAYRPRITDDVAVQDKMAGMITCCWQESPDLRPDMHSVLKLLIDINGGRKINILDNMIKMLEAYSNNLEELVANRTEELAQEKQKTDSLLYQMLPPLVAEQLKRGEQVRPETYSEASIFFSDIVGFTSISGDSTPLQVIDLLNDLYTTFDEIIGMHDVYKVETIGDAYMVTSGIPRKNGKRHSGEIANMALDLLSAVTSFRIRHKPEAKLQLRVGLHTGACAAGVVGSMMPRYCLFGDTVNMASRMESTGKGLHIHVSNDFADSLRSLDDTFLLLERGIIDVKGKGLQKTYWLVGKEGYNEPLPEEMTRLQKKYEDILERGCPMSPTDTHISASGQQESTSMYGNAFRRASYAIRFLRTLSHTSRESSPTGSNITVRDFDEDEENGPDLLQTLNIPNNKLKLPTVNPQALSSDESTSSNGRKKKKSKKKKKQKEFLNNLNIPTIEITSQSS
ncbi:hypothetical protein ACF0H5_017228 [Mactra antiquata]